MVCSEWLFKKQARSGRLLALVALVATSAARAEWVAVQGFEDSYYDPSSIHVEGSKRKVLQLTDARGKDPSMIALIEYDCSNKKYQLLTADIFLGPMGTGEKKPLPMSPPIWKPVKHQIGLQISRLVCSASAGKKR